jgi:hypothetical protein
MILTLHFAKQAMAIVPLFFFLSGDVPPTVKVACGVTVAIATTANAVDLAFPNWDPEAAAAAAAAIPQYNGSADDGPAVPAAAAAAQLQWQLPMLAMPAAASSSGAAFLHQGVKALDYPRKRN